MGPYCMGIAPQHFSLANIGVFLKTLMDAEFFLHPSQCGWFWIAGVGEIILKPFELYSASYNASGPFVQPSLMFSLSTAEVQSIAQYNPSLKPAQFYLAANGAAVADRQHESSRRLPVARYPADTGAGHPDRHQRPGPKHGWHGEGRGRCGIVRVHVDC